MIILQDSREKVKHHDHVLKGFKQLGMRVIRTKLYVGDYTLPTNQSVCVDTKQGLQEVYGNVIQDHERFRREAIAAQEAGIRLVILVEESGIKTLDDVERWKNPREKIWNRMPESRRKGRKPPVKPETLAKAMRTMQEKYGVEWRFCAKYETAKVICEVLGIEY